MLKAGLLALLASAAAVAPALAWDDQGHMMIAAVAYDKLAKGFALDIPRVAARTG